MPGGNDNEVNALYEIACNTRAMAINAGVADPGGNGYVNDEDALSQQIACNLFATNQALGGTCSPTWVDQATAWQAILQLSVELASLTGTPSDQGFYELPLNGVLCNLEQVATNTGSSTPPPQNLNATPGIGAVNLNWDVDGAPDSFNVYRSLVDGGPYTFLANVGGGFSGYDDGAVSQGTTYYYVVTAVLGGVESVYSNQASAAPISDLQLFINQLLDFAPDLLIIADTFVGSNGDPVASAPDSSGNNNPMVQANAGRRPTLGSGPNGKKAYVFAGPGVTGYLQCPFPGLTTMASVVVFNSPVGENTNTNRMVGTMGGLDGAYAGPNTPIMQFVNAPSIGIFGSAFGAALPITPGSWQSNACWITGLGSKMLDQDGNSNVSAVGGSEAPDPAVYAAIGGDSAGAALCFTGGIAFHARWATAPSDSDIAAFLALVNAYYGL